MLLLQGMIIAILVAIAWQDFKERAVYAIFFPVLIALLAIRGLLFDSFSLINCMINLGIVGIQTSFLYLYLFAKEKALPALESYIGLGDILFFVVIAFVFPPAAFLIFQLGSFLITLLFVSTIKNKDTIPLAGCQSVLLLVVLVAFQLKDRSVYEADNLLFHHLSWLYGY